jgi:transposase
VAHKVIPRKHHRYLTLVSDHGTSTIVWGAPGKDAATLGKFFDALPEGGLDQVEAVSMDLGLAYIKAVRARAPDAVICFDPFHVIKLVTDALDSVRRRVWQSARRYPDKAIAKKYKGARWALLKTGEPKFLGENHIRKSAHGSLLTVHPSCQQLLSERGGAAGTGIESAGICVAGELVPAP